MIRLSPLRVATICICVLGLSVVPLKSLSAEEASPAPGSWPQSEQLSPSVTAWPNLIRIWGPDRYQTNLTTSLIMRGGGGYPFDSPDSRGGGSSYSLSDNDNWWGLDSCPRAVIITAGDSPADSLAAASLSNPVGFSVGPYLRRVASADPLFDPIGGFQYVNTHFAPVLITESTRSGKTSLTLATRVAIKDLRSGGCTLARDAVIVGGPSAVSIEIEQELLSIGIRQVFRVSGKNRYETASNAAQALGTHKNPLNTQNCQDRYSFDGQVESYFYAPSVVEWRQSSSQCELLDRSVVLVDGISGADALAAAWWISFWQVPVLLHNGSHRLPDATALALQSLDISNVIVLGGTSRVPEVVEAEAARLSNSRALRIGGSNRYETSVRMAQYFGGWWGTGVGTERQASIICFAASSAGSAKPIGWPDALGAGPLCGAAANQATALRAPSRSTYPHSGPYSQVLRSPSKRNQSMVPIILLSAGSRNIPPTVRQFLQDSYPGNANWCSSVKSTVGCLQPGFGVVFGGTSVISEGLLSSLSALLAGQEFEIHKRSRPELIHPFVTELEMPPSFFQMGNGNLRFCIPRGGYEGARWLVIRSGGGDRFVAQADVVGQGWYKGEPGGLAPQSLSGSPGCLRFQDPEELAVSLELVGPEGWTSPVQDISLLPETSFKMADPIRTANPSSIAGASFSVVDMVGGLTEGVFWTSSPGVVSQVRGVSKVITSSELKFNLLRSNGSGTTTFRADWALNFSDERLTGAAEGEVRLVDGIWMARGRSILGTSTSPDSMVGGFSADIPAKSASALDFSAKWQLDLAQTTSKN